MGGFFVAASALLVAVSFLSAGGLPAAGRVRPTFVPEWHLGERWEVWLREERRGADGRLLQRSNRYRYAVLAEVARAPGVRELHLRVRPFKKRSWKRAHLVFVRRLPLEFGAAGAVPGGAGGGAGGVAGGGSGTGECLYLARVTVQTPGARPRRATMDFESVSGGPAPVLTFGTPLPVSFPLFEVRPLMGVDSRTFRPAEGGTDRNALPTLRQVVVDAPPAPVGRDVLKVNPRGLLEYRLESAADPLSFIRQVWHPDYPWYVYARGPGRRSGLARVWRVEGDPMDLVEDAGRLARRLGGPGERAALWGFEKMLAAPLREKAPGAGAAGTGRGERRRSARGSIRRLLAGFALRGITPLYARMSGGKEALVDVGGLSAGGDLLRREVRCVVEGGRWRLASGLEPAGGAAGRPASAPSPPAGPPGAAGPAGASGAG